MGIEYLDGGRITGLSTDAKPDRDTSDTTSPALTIQAGSVFIETDTGARYVHNGTAWIQQSFDSLNSAFGRSGGVAQRQHFVEWFNGHSLNDNIWGVVIRNNSDTTAYPAGSVSMGGINEGVVIKCGMENNNVAAIGFSANLTDTGTGWSVNLIRPYDPKGSVCMFVARMNHMNSHGGGSYGFNNSVAGSIVGSGDCAMFGYTFWTPGNKWRCQQADGSNMTGSGQSGENSTSLMTDTIQDQNAHLFKVECLPSSVEYSMDGVLETTGSTYAPTSKMGLCFGNYTHEMMNEHPTTYVTYCEAWNK